MESSVSWESPGLPQTPALETGPEGRLSQNEKAVFVEMLL